MFALAFLLLCSAAHADLYRWIDAESGSVKFSSTPPPWFESGSGPQVERIPFTAAGARAPGADPLAPTPAAALQARWQEMLLTVSSQPTREGLQALAALTAELDRADPPGAQRRQQALTSVLRSLQK